MKQSPDADIERFRVRIGPYASTPGDRFGLFHARRRGVNLVILSSGTPGEAEDADRQWEHVSVSTPIRCPTWEEMCWVKSLFFRPEETVIQFHPAESDYVNNHEFCLHLWRHCVREHVLPPRVMV